jgi:hypothetical protein
MEKCILHVHCIKIYVVAKFLLLFGENWLKFQNVLDLTKETLNGEKKIVYIFTINI